MNSCVREYVHLHQTTHFVPTKLNDFTVKEIDELEVSQHRVGPSLWLQWFTSVLFFMN